MSFSEIKGTKDVLVYEEESSFTQKEDFGEDCGVVIEKPRYVCPLGAQHTVLAIPGGVPIVHAGPGCAAKLSLFLNDMAGNQGGGDLGGAQIPSTNFSENEVVFGGEDKLRAAVEGSVKVMAGDFFVILTGCTPDIVGDDAEGVAREFRRRGLPVTFAETAGFKGNNFQGHELVNRAIIEDLLPMGKGKVQKGLVNVFMGIPFQDPYWRGDLSRIGRLISQIGLIPNLLYGKESLGFKAWERIAEAEFTLVLHPWLDYSAAKLIEEKYDVPIFHYPAAPSGAAESTRFLRALGKFAGVSSKKVEKVVGFEEGVFYDYLTSAAEYLTESRNGLPSRFSSISGSGAALSYARFFVNEMGFSPGEIIITDSPPEEYRESIVSYFKNLDGTSASPKFVDDGGKAAEILAEELRQNPDSLVLASSWERDLCQGLRAHLLRTSLPIYDRLIISKSYLGYEGGLSFLEDLHAEVLGKSA
jgi:nitrogenase molybdenum-iron protein beta chain